MILIQSVSIIITLRYDEEGTQVLVGQIYDIIGLYIDIRYCEKDFMCYEME
jgi:hypothetical protein